MKRLTQLAAACATFVLSASIGYADLPKVGEMAPDFELKGSDGTTYKLSDLVEEQAVVVAWYPKAFTGG